MSLKVLLVDDDAMIIFLHKYVVQISGLSSDPVCLANGEEAIDYLQVNYSSGDHYLVLLDINMPVMDGWGFLDAIQAMPFTDLIIVIVVSSSIDNHDRERALKYKHVIDFIEKPLDVELCEQIKRLPQLKAFN